MLCYLIESLKQKLNQNFVGSLLFLFLDMRYIHSYIIFLHVTSNYNYFDIINNSHKIYICVCVYKNINIIINIKITISCGLIPRFEEPNFNNSTVFNAIGLYLVFISDVTEITLLKKKKRKEYYKIILKYNKNTKQYGEIL
jgi:hypothetical protein